MNKIKITRIHGVYVYMWCYEVGSKVVQYIDNEIKHKILPQFAGNLTMDVIVK